MERNDYVRITRREIMDDLRRRELEEHAKKHTGAAKILERGRAPDVAVGNTFGGEHLVLVDREWFVGDAILDYEDRDIVEYLLLMGANKGTILQG